MSILIGTPCYSGVTVPYFRSVLNLQESFLAAGVDFDVLVTTNESLITRARNTMAREFLKTRFQKLMLVDADIEFAPEDVAKLWNHDLGLVVAAYPWKKPGKKTTAWVGRELVEISALQGLTEVSYAGTGFMMIDRLLLEALKAHVEHYDESGECWDFFGTYVTKGARWEHRFFLSEDYAFCQRVKDMGESVLLDPSIKLKHHGSYAYDGA